MARGFFAEIQRQSRQVQRDRERQAREEERRYKAAVRESERARKAAERARAQYARASAADQKRLAKEAQDDHVAAMQAEVDEQNLALAQVYEELDSLLAATLGVDDFVDLNSLKRRPEHPPFDRTDLEMPIPLPAVIPDPPAPVLVTPPSPTGLKSLFGKKKHAQSVLIAGQNHEAAVAAWKTYCEQVESLRRTAAHDHAIHEGKRLKLLEAERARYARQCAARDAEVAKHNAAIDQLIADLGYGVAEAVQEYISIVLSNSVYPEHFPVEHDFSFEPRTAELKLRALVPGPHAIESTKAYKYTKASDEITSSSLSQKECRERYASAVQQVALRSLHEVFEADRRGLIATITLEVGTHTTDPATGLDTYISFVAVASERESFLKLNLANVVPQATLEHLGASVSKNPFGLVAANTKGVRRA